MQRTFKSVMLILSVVLFLCATANCISDNKNIKTEIQTEKLTYRFKLKDIDSFVIFNGVLYSSTKRTLTARDLTTRKEIWSYKNPINIQKWFYIVMEQVVYVGNGQFVVALDRMTGKKIWGFNEMGFGNFSIAYFGYSNGSIYILTREIIGGERRICALDPPTGKVRWKNLINSSFSFKTFFYLKDSVLYFNSVDYIYAVDNVSGEIKWSCHLPVYLSSTNSIAGTSIKKYDLQALPLFIGSNMVLVSKQLVNGGAFFPKGNIFALNIDTGQLEWKKDVFSFSSIILDNDNVYYSDYDSLRAINVVSGLEDRFEIEGHVKYITVVDRTLYCISKDNICYAIDLNTNNVKWRSTITSSLVKGLIISGEEIYCICDDNCLYVLNLLDGQIIGQFELDGKLDAGSPVIVDRALYYLDTEKTLYSLELPLILN